MEVRTALSVPIGADGRPLGFSGAFVSPAPANRDPARPRYAPRMAWIARRVVAPPGPARERPRLRRRGTLEHPRRSPAPRLRGDRRALVDSRRRLAGARGERPRPGNAREPARSIRPGRPVGNHRRRTSPVSRGPDRLFRLRPLARSRAPPPQVPARFAAARHPLRALRYSAQRRPRDRDGLARRGRSARRRQTGRRRSDRRPARRALENAPEP